MNQLLSITIILIIFCIVTISAIIFYFSRKLRDMVDLQRGDQGMQFLNQNIQALNRAVNERLDGAARVMMAVNSELGQMREIGSNLKNLQDFLKSPKLRGNLGEQGLKELLSQALPTQYFQTQFSFRDGSIVDAIILLEGGKIPIDAKFPLENFNQMLRATSDEARLAYRRRFREDFRRHTNNISKKYLHPDEGTTDFAFMYIPSESIYFEIVNNEQDLFEYAAHQRIIISSPSTFFYYLRTIMLGFQGKRITQMSREIIKILKAIKQQSGLLGENLTVLNRHIANSGKVMSTVAEQYDKLAQRIEKVDSLEEGQVRLLEDEYQK